jgi:outer membrane receptor protein involved in Fe transport
MTAFQGRNASVISVGGMTTMPGGVGGLPTYLYGWKFFQGYDDAFFSHGKHSIKLGGAIEDMHMRMVAEPDPNGVWSFSTLQDFLQNNPTKFNGGVITSVRPRNFRQSIYGAYLQDDWRALSSLTLNLGLPYEMATIPTETHVSRCSLYLPMPCSPLSSQYNFQEPA